MKLRARSKGDITDIRVLMLHDMETGRRKDANGETVAAWYFVFAQTAELLTTNG